MNRKLNYKRWFVLVLLLLISITGYSKELDNVIRLDQCENCGNVLVGAARVQPDAIQWIGSNSPQLLEINTENSTTFGFTAPKTGWGMVSPFYYVNNSPPPNRAASSLGFFFAPQSAGDAVSAIKVRTITYTSAPQPVRGTGILDNESAPALTLDVQSSSASSTTLCPSSPGGTMNDENCHELSIPKFGTVTFTVTPKVDPALVPANVLGVEQVMLYLQVNERCSFGQNSFQESIMTPSDFSPATYYHYLSPLKAEDASKSCPRTHPALVSVGKPVEIKVTNKKEIGTDYVEYTFYIFGHYDSANPAKWPGSHKTFRLRTASGIVVTPPDDTTPINHQLTVSVTGNGSVSSGSNEINACTSAGGICIATFQTGTLVQLTATPSKPSDTVSWSCGESTGQTTKITMGSNNVLCTATFTSVPSDDNKPVAQFTATPIQGTAPLKVALDASASNGTQYNWTITNSDDNTTLSPSPVNTAISSVTFSTPGIYTIALQVKDESENSSTSPEQQIVVESPPLINEALTADFTIETPTLEEVLEAGKDPFSITLKASYPNAVGYEWVVFQITREELDRKEDPKKERESTSSSLDTGDYLVVLQVTNATQTAVTSQTITLPQPLAAFTATPPAGNSPLPVELNASKTEEYFKRLGMTVTDWQWWRNDGESISDRLPTITTIFNTPGEKVITLLATLATTDKGQQVTASQIIYVGDYQTPVATISTPTIWLGGNDLIVQVDSSTSQANLPTEGPETYITDRQWTVQEYVLKEEGTMEKIDGTDQDHFVVDRDKEPTWEERGSEIFDQHSTVAKIPLKEPTIVINTEPTPFRETLYQQIILQVTNNVGLTGYAGTALMQVSRGISAGKDGVLDLDSDLGTTFLGSTNLDPNPNIKKYMFAPSDPIYLTVDISVGPQDVGEKAEVLSVIDIDPLDKVKDRIHWMKTGPFFEPWDYQISSLVSFEKEVVLQNQLTRVILNGTLVNNGLDPRQGKYNVYVGYRLENGKVVFNGNSITFVVQ